MSHYLFLILLLFPSFAFADQVVTLKPEDYGGHLESPNFDNGPAIQAMCREAMKLSQSGHEVAIVFGKGSYHIWDTGLEERKLFISNHDHEAERPVALFLHHVQNISIVGDSTLLLFHGRLIPIVLDKSKNVSITGLQIDYPRPALTQIEIVDVRKDKVRARVLSETKWHIAQNRFIIEGEGYELPLEATMAYNEKGFMKRGRADVWFGASKLTRLGNDELLIEGWDEEKFLEKGDVYVLRSYARPTPGIVISDSEGINLKTCHIHYAEGMGLIAQNSDNIFLDQFNVTIAPNSKRHFTTQADATHFSGCRGVVRATNGIYENMADDAINVHGTYLRVDALIDDHTLKVSFAHAQSFGFGWYRKGDHGRLVSRQTMQPLFESKIVGFRVISPKEAEVTFEDPIDQKLQMNWCNTSWVLENLSAYPEVNFSHNIVRHNRARGALFSTIKKVRCYQNTFDHTHGSAILLNGDANGWFESGPCSDIEIYQNRFINALTARYQFTNGVISIVPNIPSPIPGLYYHGRVVIRDNEFYTFPSPLYYIQGVRELILKDNRIFPNNDYAPIFEDPHSVVI